MSKFTNTYSQSNWKYDKRKTNIHYNEKDVYFTGTFSVRDTYNPTFLFNKPVVCSSIMISKDKKRENTN